MAKYKVKRTDILHNKTLYAEGSTIELTDVQAKQLADYLELIQGGENKTPKEEKPKRVKPATETKPAKQTESKQVETQKVPEKPITSASTPVTPEVKPQNQVPPAAQKVIASAINQVNKTISNTPVQRSQPFVPPNMRRA